MNRPAIVALALLCACGQPTAARPDAGPAPEVDAGPGPGLDAGTLDAGPPDAGPEDAGPADAGSGPVLVLPEVIDLPYVVAGAGGSRLDVEVRNDGDAPLTGLAFALTAAPGLHLDAAPTSLAGHARGTLSLSYAGAAAEEIAEAALEVQGRQVPVFGVAGDPGLGAAAWQAVEGAGNVFCGEGATVAMPTAPFPDPSGSWTDPSVRVFVPDGYRERAAHDVVLHFHGFSTTLADTLVGHHYQEHLFASGVNAILVVPQGPVNAATGNFGKLMHPAGTAALLRQALVLLYREGKLTRPRLGEVALTSHSGGYSAVAANLGSPKVPVAQVDLFDSIYGYESTFEAFALGGGRLRSDYTDSGGTLDNNQAVAAYLASRTTVSTAPTPRALRDDPAVIYEAPTSHNNSTRWDGAYGEWLRWGMRHHRRGPRVQLRSALPQGANAVVRWLSPRDEDLLGFAVETSADGVNWQVVATAGPTDEQATLPLASGVRVRVRPRVAGLADAEAQPSNSYRVDPGASVLVVDRFDRLLGGSWGGLANDFAARVGEAVPGGVATVHHRALAEDGVRLEDWAAVVWLAGDSSSDDHTFDADDRARVQAYLAAGGHLVASGSEIGYDLAGASAAASFLDGTLGAHYAADDSGSYSVSGDGPLAGLAAFGYAGPGAPYAEDYPDAFTAPAGAQVVLRYATGAGAAAGFAGKSALVGFPLELVDDPADRARALAALLGYAGH